MSVVVMGVDIPEDCDGCWLPGKHCNLWIATDVGERHRDCPIRPLPERHGKLIDADAFKAMCRENVEDLRNSVIFPHERMMVERLAEATEALCLDLDEAPTIVEAEGE